MPEVVVIGAGIAGLSAAAELARDCSVRVLEMEHTPAYHTSGRSAALFIPSYGPPAVRYLCRASRQWFDSNAEGQSEAPLMSHRYVIYVAGQDSVSDLDDLIEEMGETGDTLERLDGAATREFCPAIRPEWLAAAGLDKQSYDLDVAAIVSVQRRLLKQRGGLLDLDHRVTALQRTSAGWKLTTTSGGVTCDVVVNAAGAWVDVVAKLAGIDPLGFQPNRRTIGIARLEPGKDPGIAFVAHAAEEFYFGAEANGVLFSPTDVTPSDPCDAKPEEIDIAYAIDRINIATTLELRSVQSSWAGLRTFCPDGSLVLGPDPADPTFVWCGGQGGYGIETSPAASRATAALTLGHELPSDLLETGLTAEALGPARLQPAP